MAVLLPRKRHCLKTSIKDELPCFIVDDHNDVLPHIHKAIRQRILPESGLRMMHWDAHPDLMVTPDMPAEVCFRPYDLYQALDESEAGIAEWILPLVYEGHLEELWWIRPPWADQMSDGHHRFGVGRVDATGFLRVTSTAPYYVDERLFCKAEGMGNIKPLDLHVSLVPPRLGSDADEEIKSGEGIAPGPAVTGGKGTPSYQAEAVEALLTDPWVLDICLDYFTTVNPFMTELDRKWGENSQDAKIVREVYGKPLFRGADTPLPHATQVEHELIFTQAVELLMKFGEEEGGDRATVGQKHAFASSSLTTSTGEAVIEAPLEAMMGSSEGLERLAGLYRDVEEGRRLARAFSDMLRRMNKEERDMVQWVGHCSLLPHHIASREDVTTAVRRTEVCLRSLLVQQQGPQVGKFKGSTDNMDGRSRGYGGWPGLVTIARSEGDGYLPVDMAEFVELEVLSMLKRVYGKDRLRVSYNEGLKQAV